MEFTILYYSMNKVLCYNQIALGIDEEEAAGLNNMSASTFESISIITGSSGLFYTKIGHKLIINWIYMQCPNDQTTLLMTERQGIEIDYCPTCRGVWLDRGELDKLIETNESADTHNQQTIPQVRYQEPRQQQNQRLNDYDDHSYSHKKRKKESLLGELFDF